MKESTNDRNRIRRLREKYKRRVVTVGIVLFLVGLLLGLFLGSRLLGHRNDNTVPVTPAVTPVLPSAGGETAEGEGRLVGDASDFDSELGGDSVGFLTDDEENNTLVLDATPTPEPTPEPITGLLGAKFTEKFTDGEVIYTDGDPMTAEAYYYTNQVVWYDETGTRHEVPGCVFQDDGASEDTITNVEAVTLAGDVVVFAVEQGEHVTADDIGWRYSYRRTDTKIYMAQLETGDLQTLFER